MKLKIGDRVKVTSLSDEEGDQTSLGKIGTVERVDNECGEDFYLVSFSDGTKDGFWVEELTRYN